ncbi:MAG: MBL fold metallo-hydrolase [Peptostreptococcaceae bacterium]
MIIQTIEDRFMGENTYLLGDENTNKCAIIDPGASLVDILAAVKKRKLTVEYIILTHGHADHIANVNKLKAETNAKIVAHENEKELLVDRKKNLSVRFPCGPQEFDADVYVKDKDRLELGELRLTFMYTPGHTPGGMCIKVGEHMFTGDTLFAGSIGRTDFYGGDNKQMNKSLRKLANQDGNITIYPGHGPTSTIERERLSNPYMN